MAEVLFRGRPNFRTVYKYLVVLGILVAVGSIALLNENEALRDGAIGAYVAFAILVCAFTLYKTFSCSYEITDEVVAKISGIMSVKKHVIPLGKIDNLSTSQNLLGIILGLGSIEIDTAGGYGMEMRLDYLEAKTMNELLEKIGERIG
ncbi:MAG: PH domain-containing protein [Candidatus Micrarchaeota archaeon]